MAITTVDAIVAYMMFMTELYWLLTLDPLARIPGRAIDRGRDPEGSKQNEDSAKDADLCQRVGAVMENLWHSAALLIPNHKSRISAAEKDRDQG